MNHLSGSPYKTACIRHRARESTFRGRGIVLTDGGGNRKDAQGNIIALLDGAGGVVVNYIYDAWGNHAVLDANGADITDPNHIGVLNPFRYRGYFYDVETGLPYTYKGKAATGFIRFFGQGGRANYAFVGMKGSRVATFGIRSVSNLIKDLGITMFIL